MKKNILINSGLALALLALATITALSYWQMNQIVRHERAENLTFSVIQNLDRLLGDLREARADLRDYSMSGDEQYVRSFYEVFKNVEGDLKSLDVLSRNQPRIQKRLAGIEGLSRQRLATLEKRIHGGDRGAISEGGGTGDKGKGEVTALRNQVNAAKEEVVSLMREVSAKQESDFRKMGRLAVINGVSICGLFIMVFLLLRQDIIRRIKGEQELVRHRAELEEQVEARTRELVWANRDLTSEIGERERVEEALRQKEKTYRSLFENSLDAVLLTASNGKILSANNAASEMFGMAEDELMGVDWAGIVDPADIRLAAALEERSRYGRMSCELDFLRKDGSLLTAEVGSITLDDGMSAFVMIHDISERKWAEKIKRKYGEYEFAIQEKERLALSREVHDGIGQKLTVLKLDLSWIERHAGSGGVELAERLKDMRANMDDLIRKAQQITADLRPPLLDNLGLAAAIEWQAREFERRSGIECHRVLREEVEICDEHTATTVIRIFQEALTNIIRHSGATRVDISLYELDGRITLTVADNGRGITIQEIDSPTAYGIMGMRERTAICGGELSISGTPGEGTAIRLSLPRTTNAC